MQSKLKMLAAAALVVAFGASYSPTTEAKDWAWKNNVKASGNFGARSSAPKRSSAPALPAYRSAPAARSSEAIVRRAPADRGVRQVYRAPFGSRVRF